MRRGRASGRPDRGGRPSPRQRRRVLPGRGGARRPRPARAPAAAARAPLEPPRRRGRAAAGGERRGRASGATPGAERGRALRRAGTRAAGAGPGGGRRARQPREVGAAFGVPNRPGRPADRPPERLHCSAEPRPAATGVPSSLEPAARGALSWGRSAGRGGQVGAALCRPAPTAGRLPGGRGFLPAAAVRRLTPGSAFPPEVFAFLLCSMKTRGRSQIYCQWQGWVWRQF